MLPPQIQHDGLTLRPLTMRVIAEKPDLDPAGLAHRLMPFYRPGDAIYYWDGPWGVLAGSRGVAIVRGSRVVTTVSTVMS